MPVHDALVEIVPCDATWPPRFEDDRDILASAHSSWLAGPIEHMRITALALAEAYPQP